MLVRFLQTNLYCIQITKHNFNVYKKKTINVSIYLKCSVCENMHVNVAFSTLLITPKMLAPCGLNLHFYIFFHGPCA